MEVAHDQRTPSKQIDQKLLRPLLDFESTIEFSTNKSR